ncbi:MAG: amidohydrolase family protein [Egibacteraceae bacterium]
MSEPRLPIELGPVSSDEYAPLPVSPTVAEAARRAMAAAGDSAGRTNMSRRSFLRSAAGYASVLFFLNACAREAARNAPEPATPGGSFDVSGEAAIDQEAAGAAVGGEEFVFDVQSHLLQFDLEQPAGSFFGQNFPQAGCGDGDPRACFSIEHYLEEIFLNSDTTMMVLSALPIVTRDHPLSIEVMEQARELADRLCGPGRLLLHGQANPSLGALEDTLAGMERLVADHPVAAWKVYTHAAGPGWRLDDGDPAAPAVGRAFIEQARTLGVPRVCVHKGVSGNDPWSSPADIGPAAAAYPDVTFVVYHSGWEPGVPEGPYDQATRDVGVNRLIASLRDAGVGPGGNAYAELGTTWFNLMRSPDEAAHVLGKLLLHLGPANIMWGTDSIWYGSPQQQIVAFRAFELSSELMDRYGYPPLTPEVKRAILGGNAARIYGVDPLTVRCTFSRQELEAIRQGRAG